MKPFARFRGLIAALSLLAGAGTAVAQDSYPNQPVKLIIPFPPGGTTDIVGRLIAQGLSTSTGQSFVVDKAFVRKALGNLLEGEDLSKYIL